MPVRRWGKRHVDKPARRSEVMVTETRLAQQLQAEEESLVVVEADLGDDAVTNAKLANMNQATIKGRAAGAGTGNPTDLSASQVKTIIGSTDTADITNDAVTNAKLANMAEATFKMRAAGAGTGDPIDGTPGQAKTALGIVVAQTYTQTYSTADRTHANPTAAALTDNTGGTANTTIENVPAATDNGGGAANLASVNTALTAIENNICDLTDSVNKLISDLADTKQLLNAVIDDLQTAGIVT